MTSVAEQDGFENADAQHDFVAVRNRNTKTTTTWKAKNTKGKGKYVPPPEIPLSQLLQKKVDLLQGSTFLQSCLGRRKHITMTIRALGFNGYLRFRYIAEHI
jgi:hypothetical protein